MNRKAIFEIVQKHMHIIINKFENQEVDENKSMVDYGADSLEIVEIVSRSMKELNLRIKRVELSEAKNICDLIDIFEREKNKVLT